MTKKNLHLILGFTGFIWLCSTDTNVNIVSKQNYEGMVYLSKQFKA